jgi:hypothetical protein
MHRLRTAWLALMGGALLVTLSVSTAFGAPPEKDGPPGQKVSGFVHELIFGSEEETDEDEVVEEEPADEDEDVTDDDEDGSEEDEDAEEDVDEDVDEDGEETADREVPEEFANHGECVSAATHDTEGFEDSEAANKGEWVSMHARYVCWGLDVPGEEPEEDVDDEDSTNDEDADDEDADEASAIEQAKAERAAARAERKAARAAAREERAAARAERHFTNAANRGGGRGRGH